MVLASGYTDLGAAQAESLGLPRLAKPFVQSDINKVITEHCLGPPEPERAGAMDA